MIGKGIQYGYVCTAEAFVFLYIPDDPATVYFSVCVPNLDVMDDDDTRLHRTAAAQVFAFILQAVRARPRPESWHDEAERLGTWAVEYDAMLRRIPETVRKGKEPRASPYKPHRWKGFERSPIRTRSRCQPPDATVRRQEEDDDAEDPPSPTPTQPRTGGRVVPSTTKGSGSGAKRRRRRRGKQQEQGQATETDTQSRPFCTQRCLLGLAYGGPMDEHCPNADHHGQAHIDQLATDRGPDADPMRIVRRSIYAGHAARSSRCACRATATRSSPRAWKFSTVPSLLQHENEVYDRLQPIQGTYVPVCLGHINLVKPYYYDSDVYTHFMFLSWAGRPLSYCGDRVNAAQAVNAVAAIFKAVHELRVLHRDAEPRNILYDTDSGSLMVVDFERAEFDGRQPLGSVGANGVHRKRKRGILQKQGKDEFASELESAVENVSRCLLASSLSR